MNMGVADSVDLGWKLAAVLQGWGGPMLLDSYETERRPVHAMVLDEAESNHKLLSNHLWRPGLDEDTDEGRSMRANTGAQIAQAKERDRNAEQGITNGLFHANRLTKAAERSGYW